MKNNKTIYGLYYGKYSGPGLHYSRTSKNAIEISLDCSFQNFYGRSPQGVSNEKQRGVLAYFILEDVAVVEDGLAIGLCPWLILQHQPMDVHVAVAVEILVLSTSCLSGRHNISGFRPPGDGSRNNGLLEGQEKRDKYTNSRYKYIYCNHLRCDKSTKIILKTRNPAF